MAKTINMVMHIEKEKNGFLFSCDSKNGFRFFCVFDSVESGKRYIKDRYTSYRESKINWIFRNKENRA